MSRLEQDSAHHADRARRRRQQAEDTTEAVQGATETDK